MREASGHMRFSWKSEQTISHLLQPLHFERSLAIHIAPTNNKPPDMLRDLKLCKFPFKTYVSFHLKLDPSELAAANLKYTRVRF
jgi:hypothetical protein